MARITGGSRLRQGFGAQAVIMAMISRRAPQGHRELSSANTRREPDLGPRPCNRRDSLTRIESKEGKKWSRRRWARNGDRRPANGACFGPLPRP
jgi:hypothetical protein